MLFILFLAENQQNQRKISLIKHTCKLCGRNFGIRLMDEKYKKEIHDHIMKHKLLNEKPHIQRVAHVQKHDAQQKGKFSANIMTMIHSVYFQPVHSTHFSFCLYLLSAFVCSICGKNNESNYMLNIHMKIIHPETIERKMDTILPMIRANSTTIHPKLNIEKMDPIPPLMSASRNTIDPISITKKADERKMDTISPIIMANPATIHPKLNIEKMDPIPPLISASGNATDPISISTKKVDTSAREKMCRICGYDYKYFGQFEIENHAKKHVGVEIPFKCPCPYCPRRFECNSKLVRHIGQKHSEHKSK